MFQLKHHAQYIAFPVNIPDTEKFLVKQSLFLLDILVYLIMSDINVRYSLFNFNVLKHLHFSNFLLRIYLHHSNINLV